MEERNLVDIPSSELHEPIRQRHGGRMPIRFLYRDKSEIIDPDKALRDPLRTPWHERVRRAYQSIRDYFS